MSRKGYGFEREIELWLCDLAEIDSHEDFSMRPFRTATSGAAVSSKGDVRAVSMFGILPLCIECKHLNKWSAQKGAIFHLYVDWMEKIIKEAEPTKSLPMVTWAFKNVRTNRGKGRVQFAMPKATFDYLWEQVPKINNFTQFQKLSDVVKYVERKKKYYLVYHDQLWELAHNPDLITIFHLQQHDWVVISKNHLEMIMVGIREHYKGNHGAET